MGIIQNSQTLHWNYYLTLEDDLRNLARYIDINSNNFKTYSIELVRILQIAASEIDVVLKLLCLKLNPNGNFENISNYKSEIQMSWPEMIEEKVFSSQYGLVLTPWENWKCSSNPKWWHSYNNVKHQRNLYYQEANLKNVLNAVAALLVCTSYYYLINLNNTKDLSQFKEVFLKLKINSDFFSLNDHYYYSNLIVS